MADSIGSTRVHCQALMRHACKSPATSVVNRCVSLIDRQELLWPSLITCNERLTMRVNICKCASGSIVSAYGFMWEYT